MEKKFMKTKKYVLMIILAVISICMIISSANASISPDTVTRTLKPGDCYTVTKTVTIPQFTPRVDVVFSFDLTGSMSSIIDAAKNKAGDIMTALINDYPGVSFNFGVMSYMDYVGFYSSCGYSATYGIPGDYPYSLDQPLTSSIGSVQNAIDGLMIGSGGDYPQDYTRIFYESYADSNVGWRTGANKLLVNFGDDVPHDCNLNQGVTTGTWSTGKDPGRNGNVDDGDDLDLQTVLNGMAINGVTLLEGHTNSNYDNYWTYWTGITGGDVFITSSTSFVDDVIAAIVSGITIPTIGNIHLEVTTPGYSSWLSSVVPASYSDVNAGDVLTFEETICVPQDAACGVYQFVVSAVDECGVSYGDQTNTITIPCDDIPPVTTKEHGSNCVYHDQVEDVWYMKPCTPIYLYARDDHPDASGVQFVYYEVWWDENCDGVYDILVESDTITDDTIKDLNLNEGEIDIEISIDEECCHKLVWYAVDNEGNFETPNEQYYRLDAAPPIISKTHPDPCYFPIDDSTGMIKVGGRIVLDSIDQGMGLCIAGIENTFWRYEYEGISFPLPNAQNAVNGSVLGQTYGYCDPDILNYWWYYDDEHVEITFDEICKHTLFYWAKDNACNRGDIYSQTYWVNDCHPEVHIDDDFGINTPGWWHTHFRSKQMALDWLGFDGIAYVYDGIYTGDIIIDSVPCCDNTGITQKGEYGCFPITESAIITGTETIKVDDVTIKYLEYTPNTDGSIIVDPCVCGTIIRCNKFNKECFNDAIGLKAYTIYGVNAELNWWGAPDGPQGGLMDDGKIADGNGVKVIGEADVEPWIGIHAEISKPSESTITVEAGEPVCFDATGSFAYTYGECCQYPEELPMQYLWNFDDGRYSSNKIHTHIFTEPGTYEVSLMVDAPGIPGLYPNYMYDWDYITVHVTLEGMPLSANADGGNLGGYNTIVGEPVQLYGDALGGLGEYIWFWDFGDQSEDSNKQNPTHIYTEPGTYMATLTVISYGETATDTAEVIVYDIDELSVNIANGNCIVGENIIYSASINGGTPPYNIAWDFGDGTTSMDTNPSHIYETSGTYTIQVTVTDDRGTIVTDTANINVEKETIPAEIRDIRGGLGIKATITTEQAVPWMIDIQGRVLFGGYKEGIAEIGVTQIKLPFTFAFGRVTITVTAGITQEKYQALMIGPFVLNIQKI